MSFDRMIEYPRLRAGWDSMADRLADGLWHSSVSLRDHVAATTDLLGPSSRSILTDAVDAGYLEKRRRRGKQVEYRVAIMGLVERPELRVR